MKKYIVLSFLLVLGTAYPAHAQWSIGVAGGGVPVAAGGDCPTGTYLFAWNGAYPSDSDKACFNSGASQKDANTAGTPAFHTDYGESGGIGIGLLTANDEANWVISSRDGFDPAQGTMYIRIKFITTESTNIFCGAYYSSSNKVEARILSTNEIQMFGYFNGNQETSNYTGSITDNTWLSFGMSWKTGEAGTDFSVTIDGGSNWADQDSDLEDWPASPSNLYVYTQSGDDVYVQKIVVTSGFKDALPLWW